MNNICAAEPCPVILNSTCVFYRGANLVYTGILTNDNLQIALEKIDNKFKNAAIGYAFNNGITQAPSAGPVQLGGPLIQDTTITSSGFDLNITETINAGKFATIGGLSSQFVKGDGSLDSTSYQPSGTYIASLTGDGTAVGPGSAVFTLTDVNTQTGTYGSGSVVPTITVDSKGRITNVVSTNITYPAQTVTVIGDVYGSGLTSSLITLTLNNVNSNIYGTNTILKFAVNAKGLVTSAAPITGSDIETLLGYVPVPSTRTLTINGQTYDLSANRSWTIASGGSVSSVSVTAGTGISASVTNPTTTPNITITNTAPDQTVSLSSGTGISVTGTYPNFTIASTVTGGVTSVTATAPLTSSGGTTPDISTSMNTNKLIGRSTAGVGVMEEITIGSGLSLSGGTLSASISGTILKGTTSGTDTYTTTIAGVSSYVDGDAYLIRFVNGNTTGATLNINGLGAKTLYRNNDGSLIGGDIISGAEMICVFNSTLDGFQTIGTAPNTLLGYVTNDDSVTITKGQVVYAFGGQGDRMTVKLASNTADATSARTVGVVLSTSIAANQKGLIMMQGLLDGLSILPTATFNDGDSVYLGATAGSITNVKPYAPNHLVYVATVTTASNGSSGRMYVNIQNGYELDELHNVQAQSPSLKDTLWYDSGVTPAQWKTASISTILGYTPQAQLNGTGFVKASGTTISYDNNTYLTEDPVILAQQAMGSTIKGVCLACRSFRDLVGGLQPVSGTLYITAYYLSQPATITGVKFYQSVGGVFTANNFNGFALFTYSAGVLTRVAITANDGNNWKFTSGTTPAIAFTSPYSASAGLYFIAGIYSTSGATTVPIMGHGGTKITAGAANADFTNTSRFTATLSSQTSMPSSITLSATTALTTNIAFYLY